MTEKSSSGDIGAAIDHTMSLHDHFTIVRVLSRSWQGLSYTIQAGVVWYKNIGADGGVFRLSPLTGSSNLGVVLSRMYFAACGVGWQAADRGVLSESL